MKVTLKDSSPKN